MVIRQVMKHIKAHVCLQEKNKRWCEILVESSSRGKFAFGLRKVRWADPVGADPSLPRGPVPPEPW